MPFSLPSESSLVLLSSRNSACRKIWNGRLILTARRWKSKQKNKTNIYLYIYIYIYIYIYLFKYIYFLFYFLFYSFVYFFIALPYGSVCRFIFFYKFNCTDPGLQLGDPVPLIGLLLWFCCHFKYFRNSATMVTWRRTSPLDSKPPRTDVLGSESLYYKNTT